MVAITDTVKNKNLKITELNRQLVLTQELSSKSQKVLIKKNGEMKKRVKQLMDELNEK